MRAPVSPVEGDRPRPRNSSTMACTSGWCTCAGRSNGKRSVRPSRASTTSASPNTGVRSSPAVPVTTISSWECGALKFQMPVPTTPEANVIEADTTSSAA